jgi:DnaD/phage-associated family protein
MKTFKGFPEGKSQLTPVPGSFFHELLPNMDNLNELKVVLYSLWRLDRMEGKFRYLRKEDFLEDEEFLKGLAGTGEHPLQALERALALAVERGVMLAADIPQGNEPFRLYFLNTPKGRAAVEAIRQEQWRPLVQDNPPAELLKELPNIFQLYEENIGALTPMIADALTDAEANYPQSWIADAFRIAVENNKRNWRYIAAILKRWQQEGRNERKDRQDTEKDRRRYIEGEYADFIEH